MTQSDNTISLCTKYTFKSLDYSLTVIHSADTTVLNNFL